MNWNECEGGTGAARGKKGYTCHLEGWGEFHIFPITYNNGRHRGYSVLWANTSGKTLKNMGSGLWHHICISCSPVRAKRACSDFLEKMKMENPA